MARHTPHVYVADVWEEGRIALTHDAQRHLDKVLRMRPPAAVTYTNGRGFTGSGTYVGHSIERGSEEQRPRPRGLTVAVAPPKNKSRVRYVVEKLAEIGVGRLLWLATDYTEGRPPSSEKAAAWTIGALEQSRGAWLMEIGGPILVSELSEFGSPVFVDPDGGPVEALGTIVDPVLCVGPEGGFSKQELAESTATLGLGPTILRVETAALVAAALVMNLPSG